METLYQFALSKSMSLDKSIKLHDKLRFAKKINIFGSKYYWHELYHQLFCLLYYSKTILKLSISSELYRFSTQNTAITMKIFKYNLMRNCLKEFNVTDKFPQWDRPQFKYVIKAVNIKRGKHYKNFWILHILWNSGMIIYLN
jgi:hypothetical protein